MPRAADLTRPGLLAAGIDEDEELGGDPGAASGGGHGARAGDRPALTLVPKLPPHLVALHAYEGTSSFELSVALEIFGLGRPELNVPWWYDAQVFSADRGSLRLLGGVTLSTAHGLELIEVADTVILTGWNVASSPPVALLDALRAAADRGARLVSLCSGAFILAAAGLLDRKSATTHWHYTRHLAKRFPRVDVREDVLWVDNGRVLTSAGSAAAIDLCLHIVRNDHGSKVANTVARRLVAPPQRQSSHKQVVVRPVPDEGTDLVTTLQAWASENLHRPITIAQMARRANVSDRTLTRKFDEAVGMSPLQWLISQRVEASLPLLESRALSVDQVATAVGFGSTVTYRQHFARIMRTTPTGWRKTARQAARSGRDVGDRSNGPPTRTGIRLADG